MSDWANTLTGATHSLQLLKYHTISTCNIQTTPIFSGAFQFGGKQALKKAGNEFRERIERITSCLPNKRAKVIQAEET
jgi:hypothetical protein